MCHIAHISIKWTLDDDNFHITFQIDHRICMRAHMILSYLLMRDASHNHPAAQFNLPFVIFLLHSRLLYVCMCVQYLLYTIAHLLRRLKHEVFVI